MTTYGYENGVRVPVYDPHLEKDTDTQYTENVAEQLSLVRKLIGFLLADNNPALGIECLALATGIAYEGASMSDIAERHNVTRATVSKRCVELCDAFGLRPSRAMRPVQNRERCRQARVRELVEA